MKINICSEQPSDVVRITILIAIMYHQDLFSFFSRQPSLKY